MQRPSRIFHVPVDQEGKGTTGTCTTQGRHALTDSEENGFLMVIDVADLFARVHSH